MASEPSFVGLGGKEAKPGWTGTGRLWVDAVDGGWAWVGGRRRRAWTAAGQTGRQRPRHSTPGPAGSPRVRRRCQGPPRAAVGAFPEVPRTLRRDREPSKSRCRRGCVEAPAGIGGGAGSRCTDTRAVPAYKPRPLCRGEWDRDPESARCAG